MLTNLLMKTLLLFYRRTLCQGTGLHLKKKLDSHLHAHISLDKPGLLSFQHTHNMPCFIV